MTLLIAGIDQNVVWMLADTAISKEIHDPKVRDNWLKIVPLTGDSLLGFSNNADEGRNAIPLVKGLQPGPEVLNVLLSIHGKRGDVDFSYAYISEGQPLLYKVANGSVECVQSLFLGSQPAFESFQEIKHRKELEYVPNAMCVILCGIADDDGSGLLIPELVEKNILAMQELFANGGDGAVGGVAIPYILSKFGARLCQYAYAVSDPVLSQIRPGVKVPLGTSQQGGFSLSVTELNGLDGVVLYWLQKPGGTVYLRKENWYEKIDFYGEPRIFVEQVQSCLGREVHLWFGEGERSIEAVVPFYGEEGERVLSATATGQYVSFVWTGEAKSPFSIKKIMEINKKNFDFGGLKVRVTKEGGDVEIDFSSIEEGGCIKLNAKQIDDLIKKLAEAKSSLSNEAPWNLVQGTKLATQVDPRWTARLEWLSETPSIMLALRHSGYGWIGYLLPKQEALSISNFILSSLPNPQHSQEG